MLALTVYWSRHLVEQLDGTVCVVVEVIDVGTDCVLVQAPC